MDLNEYQHAAARTLNVNWPERDQIANVALGLAGEYSDLIAQRPGSGRGDLWGDTGIMRALVTGDDSMTVDHGHRRCCG